MRSSDSVGQKPQLSTQPLTARELVPSAWNTSASRGPREQWPNGPNVPLSKLGLGCKELLRSHGRVRDKAKSETYSGFVANQDAQNPSTTARYTPGC